MSKDATILSQTIEQLESMNRMLEHLRTEILPKSPKMFALMAQGPLEEMRRLQTEIKQQTGRILARRRAA